MALNETATKVREMKLTYLSPPKFESLFDCISSLKDGSVPGAFVEFGIALGGSAICLALEAAPDRKFFGFDVFEMIPPPGEADGADSQARYETIRAGGSRGIRGDTYYGYQDNLYQKVADSFQTFGVEVDGQQVQLVKGLFEKTLPVTETGPIALAHIDCDWYEPVKLCLSYTFSRLEPGGYMILDDYNDWPGCKRAADEFIAETADVSLVRRHPHAVLRRSKPE